MCKWFKEMNCYVLAGEGNNQKQDFNYIGDITRLEKSFRNYAAVFENVKLVIKNEQAKEHYLNYPHICDEAVSYSHVIGVATALKDAESDAVFIGSSNIANFPLELLVNLIKNYNGESFLGYFDKKNESSNCQFLFGIYHKKLSQKIGYNINEAVSIDDLVKDNFKLIPLPKGVDASCIGI
ncbi:MAG: hypothetical protein ACE5D6_10160 [Candidatus Zixiibacteriota bacterium]